MYLISCNMVVSLLVTVAIRILFRGFTHGEMSCTTKFKPSVLLSFLDLMSPEKQFATLISFPLMYKILT